MHKENYHLDIRKNQHKKFCFILPSFFSERKGGAELQCYYIAQGLLYLGWEVHYIRENDAMKKMKEIQNGIIVHALPRRNKYLKWLNYTQLRRIMYSIRADIWYCRGSISYLSPVLHITKSLGGKLVWACSHDNQLRNCPFKYNSISLSFLLYSFNRLLFCRALIDVDRIILQTKYQKKLLNNLRGLNGIVIYNAHPTPTYIYKSERDQIVLWVGRLQKFKHPEKFIEIFRLLKNKPYKFIAIGRSMNNGLEHTFELYDTNFHNFYYLGEVSNKKVHEFLWKSKILLNTSDAEGFSNTFIEAWLRCVPVISLLVDPDNMIKKNNIGMVSGNISQMCLDIIEIMENQSAWEECSLNAQRFALKKFKIDNAIRKLEMLSIQ